jgi:aminomethyltransferase
MPRFTPFHSRTSALCSSQSWQEWSGYLSANMYELDHIHEYNAVRVSCGLFDISPLYKYSIRGRDACGLLDRVVTRDVSKCRVGKAMYTTWCDDEGKIIDDGTIARLGEDSYRLTAAIPTLTWLQDNALGFDVQIEDMSEQLGGLSIQGPTSRGVLSAISDADLAGLPYFGVLEGKVAGVPAQISRTGYTGDLGYELFVAPGDAETVWDAVMESGESYALRPAGNVALEMVRIEAGLLLIDADFTSAKQTMFAVQKSTPYELGLGWTVKLGKEYFVGQEALREEKARGAAKATVGLEIDIKALEKIYARFAMPLHLPYTAWNDSIPLYSDDEGRSHVGKATSGAWSPILKRYVVIGRVASAHGGIGTKLRMEVHVEGERFTVPAVVVPMPFFDPPRKKE